MLKSAQEYAALIVNNCCGNLEEAKNMTFDAAKAHKIVPNSFWVDVYSKLQEEVELYQAAKVETEMLVHFEVLA